MVIKDIMAAESMLQNEHQIHLETTMGSKYYKDFEIIGNVTIKFSFARLVI